MGGLFSAARDEVKKATEKGYEDIVTVMDTLQELADTKSKLFYADLASVEKLKEYKISKIQNLEIKTYVSAKEGSDVGKQVGQIVGDFMHKDWIKGITHIFQGALDLVLGSGEGQQAEQKQFYVFVHGVGINRLDFYLYSRKISFKSFSSENTQILVCGYALSSIDVKELTRADLNQIVSNKTYYDEKGKDIIDDMKLVELQKKYADELAKANGIPLE